MFDIAEVHAQAFSHLSTTTTVAGFVKALENLADALAEGVTTQQPVPSVAQPSIGSFMLYAEEGWEGTFATVLRAALADAFSNPELLTLVVWTRNENPATRNPNAYIKHIGQAGDDVLHTTVDNNEVIRFYDGVWVDLDDVVAVSF